MSYGFTEIDHLLGSAVDPQRGGEEYERLGFTVTPLSIIESIGVGNRMVLLRPLTANTANFIECMGIVDRARVPPTMADLLGGSEGMRSMVLSGPDARASHAQLKRDGFEFLPPLDLEREWTLPSGEILRPAFLVTLPAPAPLRFNFCQYRNLQPYLRAEWLAHENGAQHLSSVLAIADNAEAAVKPFEVVFARQARNRDGIFSVGPGKVQLRVGNQAALRSFIPDEWLGETRGVRYLGFEVMVASLAALRALFVRRGINFVERSHALVIAPQEACGNVLRFTESEAA
jgi:hypothetical protein